jgi:hypothetical protein
MKKFAFYILTILFLFTGCTQQVNLIDPAGSALPKQRYFGSSTTKPFSATWYLYKTTSIIDRDKSEHIIPEYLSMTEEHTFNVNKIKKAILAIHITNEQGRYYELQENYSYLTNSFYHGKNALLERKTITKKKLIAFSEMKYRTVNIEIPLDKDIYSCNYGVDILDGDGTLVLRIGKLSYSVVSY